MNKLNQKFNNIHSVTFFFPYYKVSGVPVLFLRMAQYISEKYGIETHIVDYPEGYMSRTLPKGSSVKLDYFEKGKNFQVSEDTILVLQSILPNTMHPELKIAPSTKIIFWTLYHFNLIQTIIPLQYFRDMQARLLLLNRIIMNTLLCSTRNKMQKLIEAMSQKKSIFFMDGSTLKHTLERLSMSINDPIFMPVPCDDVSVNKERERRRNKNKKKISFCWIGRLSDFKINILIYTMKKLSAYARKNSMEISMHIIGEGPLSDKMNGLNIEHKFFYIVNSGVLTKEALDQYLLGNVDVLAAMGTSALEGAKLGIPTVLLDVSYGPIKRDYKFKWLFEVENYCLGDIIDSNHFEKNNNSLEKIMDDIINQYAVVSQKTYEYCRNNHSISVVMRKFLKALNEATFFYSDMDPNIFKKGILRRVYEFVREYYSKLKLLYNH